MLHTLPSSALYCPPLPAHLVLPVLPPHCPRSMIYRKRVKLCYLEAFPTDEMLLAVLPGGKGVWWKGAKGE